MIDKEKIKKCVKQDAVIKDVCDRIPHREEAFGFIHYGIKEESIEKVRRAIDRAIDCAIAFTLREVEIEKQIFRQKLIEDKLEMEGKIVSWLSTEITLSPEDRLYVLDMLKDAFKVYGSKINKRFGVKNGEI